ncbi:hypothetical protein GIX45_03410 [Erwinia sp. CPCC 100877]|nr:hypothetical protein [Erwinia sp. CPCC 100877]
MPANYSVAEYLLNRLAENGIGHLLSDVPGDYKLFFLDRVRMGQSRSVE